MTREPIAKSTTADTEQQDNRQTLSELLGERKTPLVALGLAAMVIGGYISMLLVSTFREPDDTGDADDECCTPTGRPLDMRQGRITAIVFDQELNASEGRLGIKPLRKLMSGLARGHVLEVAVGTGRNVPFIDWDEIKAAAPLPVVVDEGDGAVVEREVKSDKELALERATRRRDKGQKGLLLPGDDAPEVLSYTGVDVSTDVLEVAWSKLRKAVPELITRRLVKTSKAEDHQAPAPTQQETKSPSSSPSATTTNAVSNPQLDTPDQVLAANIGQGRIRLYKADATLHLPPPPALLSRDSTRVHPAPPYYDTILQNFGLCSVGHPQRLLATMAAALRPGSGRIYLLEHGRGSYGWLNALLDRLAPRHFRKYGCWWNRDIEALVRAEAAEVPGLEIVGIRRPGMLQGGTLVWIELKVNPSG